MSDTRQQILDSSQYQEMLNDKLAQEKENKNTHIDYQGHLDFIVSRAMHYEQHTGVSAYKIFLQWESQRTYWWISYYQDRNMPKLDGMQVKVFDTIADLEAIALEGFRCPYCTFVSTNPYKCNSGQTVDYITGGKGVCNWAIGGFLRGLGKSLYAFVKSEKTGERLFMPIMLEGEIAVESENTL